MRLADNQRMRQEDRLGKVFSSLEQMRISTEQERRELQVQLRRIEDELSYERRRGLAQLLIMLVIIVLGVASRSSAIDTIIQPLLAEARRRRSVRRNPPRDRATIDSHLRELGPNKVPDVLSPVSPNKDFSRGNLPPRRPTTPNFGSMRKKQLKDAPYRSFSAADYAGVAKGVSRNAPTTGAPRRIARSSHLHALDADRVRAEVRDAVHDYAGVGAGMDKKDQEREKGEGRIPDHLAVDLDGPNEWTDHETEASASDVEERLQQ